VEKYFSIKSGLRQSSGGDQEILVYKTTGEFRS
jgi:hypothetical protein